VKRWTVEKVIGFGVLGYILLLMIIGLLVGAGCSESMGTGFLLGAGGSEFISQAQIDAQKSKDQLIIELAETRQAMDEAIEDGEQIQADQLKEKLIQLEDKALGVDTADYVVEKIYEGMSQDFSPETPEEASNLIRYLIEGGLGLWILLAERKKRVLSKTINRAKGESMPEKAKELHDIEKNYNKRLIP
jgi:hypothetical protein